MNDKFFDSVVKVKHEHKAFHLGGDINGQRTQRGCDSYLLKYPPVKVGFAALLTAKLIKLLTCAVFHGSLLQRPQVDTLCAHRVAGEGPGTVADSSVSRVGFRLTSAPHISVPIPSLTQNVLTAHVIGAYLSSVSPREQ